MKKLPHEQGSAEWLAWRKTVITATDCPAILGTSPWMTEYKCWQKKLGLIDEPPPNEAMKRGTLLEPEARQLFNLFAGMDMQPAVVESEEFDFLGASLDGISPCGKYILEIKCGSPLLHKQAMEGFIPPYYLHQMQHQLLVTGAEKAYYFSYSDVAPQAFTIEVLPDPDFRDIFLPKARAFWRCVAFAESPALQKSDYRDMSTDNDWLESARAYRMMCGQIKRLEELKEDLRKDLIKRAEDQNCEGAGVKVLKTVTKGRIDYEAIPELKGLDLEKYRKEPIGVWKILVN